MLTLTVEGGTITKVTGDKASTVTVDNSQSRSKFTLTNERNSGNLLFRKTVVNDNSGRKFLFTVKLSGMDEEDSKAEYTAVKTLADGSTQKETLMGRVLTLGLGVSLADGETYEIKNLPGGVSYTVTENANADFAAAATASKVNLETGASVGASEIQTNGAAASGTIGVKERDEITYTNTKLRSIRVQKNAQDADGRVMEIPDGLTLTVYGIKNTKKEILATAAWSARSKAFQVKKNSDLAAGVRFAAEEQGFVLSGLADDRFTEITVEESKGAIEGYRCEAVWQYQKTDGSWETVSSESAAFADAADGRMECLVVNTYTQTATNEWRPDATKKLTGRDMKAGEFAFALTETDQNGNVKPGGVSQRAVNLAASADEAARVLFDTIQYEAAGDFYYLLKEEIPADAEKADDGSYVYQGVTYDLTEYRIHVTAAESNGKLLVTSELADGTKTNKFAFENHYDAKSCSVSLDGKKLLDGKAASTAGQFTFVLMENEKEIGRASNDEHGLFTFPEIEYHLKDVGRHTYTIMEADGKEANMIYDGARPSVVVDVEDDGVGALHATVYKGKLSGHLFINRTVSKEHGSIVVTKEVKAMGMDIALTYDYYFALFNEDGERISEVKLLHLEEQHTNSVTFDGLAYGRYLVRETDADGNVTDGKSEDFKFNITYENDDVHLSAALPNAKASLTNDYILEVPADYTFVSSVTMTKVVKENGKEVNSHETYWARVYTDAALTVPYTDPIELNMGGASSCSVQVPVFAGEAVGDKVTYYVTEVDQNGTPLKNADLEEFTFDISGTGEIGVLVIGPGGDKEIIITNHLSPPTVETEIQTETQTEKITEKTTEKKTEKATETETEKTTEKKEVKTGDETNLLLYLMLLGMSVFGCCAGVLGKKRAKK